MDSVFKEQWFRLSFPEQMVNIGNEVKRAVRFDDNIEKKNSFLDKAMACTELTMQDPKNISGEIIKNGGNHNHKKQLSLRRGK